MKIHRFGRIEHGTVQDVVIAEPGFCDTLPGEYRELQGHEGIGWRVDGDILRPPLPKPYPFAVTG